MIVYEEDWLLPLVFRRTGSVAVRASMYAAPAAILGVLILVLDENDDFSMLRDDLGIREQTASQIWGATTAAAVFLLFFRTSQSMSRFWEGTTLLHQMRGEWFDTVSNCVTFSICAKAREPRKVMRFRHALVRLMSLAHGCALEEISDYRVQVPAIDVKGLDARTLAHLTDCHKNYHFNKVEIMLHLIQSLIVQAEKDGVLDVPAPILSRVFQTISRGFVNLLNAKKICDTRFPFPFIQLISTLLLFTVFLTPLLLSAVLENKVLMAIITFIPIFSLFSLNFIAAELDNPFGIDDNDLPLGHFQEEMNSCLMMLLHKNTDLISGLNPNCNMDFKWLYARHALGVRRLSQLKPSPSCDQLPPSSEPPERGTSTNSQDTDVSQTLGRTTRPSSGANLEQEEHGAGPCDSFLTKTYEV